ncbi:MAG TPA: arylamine N-acetyltransferase, partial [Caulobacteraceae bacterium]|nr:arylamine N-acetyltransferase [Caulobacteraceae bacterium]
LVLETRLPDGWAALYRFTLEPAEASDYEVSNWYTSTHPTFFLTNNLLAERLTPQVRLSLFNTRLTRRYPNGRAEVVDLASPEALARTLEEEFDLAPPVDPATLFTRLPVVEAGT